MTGKPDRTDEMTSEFLTTAEVADLLRIKERKVYDMAASGDVPCVRVVGKLLFPRAALEAWIDAARSGPAPEAAPLPQIVAGSHDPLLDWALRESGSDLAGFFDGSADGLERIAGHGAMAAGLHLHDPSGWNTGIVEERFEGFPVVLIEFARRRRGLIMAEGNPRKIGGIGDLAGKRFARRQPAAASQRLFEEMARTAGLDPDALEGPRGVARTEQDVALAVLDGQADAAFGLAAVAHQLRLGYVDLLEERFDLLVWRQAYFSPPFQTLRHFFDSETFRARAAAMSGYDLSGLGQVRYNAPCP